MSTVDICGQRLIVSEEAISFEGSALWTNDIEGMTVVRADFYSRGIWAGGARSVGIRGKKDTVHIDCSPRRSSDRTRADQFFDNAFEQIWSIVGPHLIARVMSALANDETVSVGGVRLDRHGVWVEGAWKFLWLKAKPRFLRWADLKIFDFSGSGALHLQSKSDPRLWTEINYNKTENSMVLDGVVRSLVHGSETVNCRNQRVPLAKHRG